MVMMCQPLYDAVMAVEAMDERKAVRVLMTPQGERLQQQRVEAMAACERLLLIAGHYEGIDERVIEELQPLEVSIGDFVVSGGELPAMALIDAVVRLLPGVLGHQDSAAEDSFAPRGDEGRRLLDCPHYTRPREWKGREVPNVLLSGDHGAVEQWRLEQMIERTRRRRPDLLEKDDES
jgi:tRNA (guanine37-N1)-methyltransferase